MKKLRDGSLVIMKPHLNHEWENNNVQSVKVLKTELKRASSENTILKHIYDEKCRR